MVRGYDHLGVNVEMLMDLQMNEGIGTIVYDSAKAHHPFVLTATATWTNLANDLTVIDFNAANPDHIACGAAACADLDFTAGDFSGACWVRGDALGNRNILTHGVHNVDGWYWYIDVNGAMNLITSQAAAYQVTIGAAGDIIVGTWRFVSFSRDGAVVNMYTNGAEVTTIAGTHVDPVTAAARNFYIGVNNAAGAAWYDGYLWRPRVWGRVLTAAEFLSLFEMERTYLGA